MLISKEYQSEIFNFSIYKNILCYTDNSYNFSKHLLAYTSNSNALSPTEDDFDLQPGDIILTKGFIWFFGHSSIALDHDTVLQIEGPGDKPITESFHSFKQRFGEGKDD